MSATEHHEREADTRTIAPIYKRLPKGPHGIAPKDVAHHQRIRMHGAMIEAVSIHGYERTSVKHVIGLAGVSRRAFYEQFANKEDCFGETFDLVVARVIRRLNLACASGKGTLEGRLRATLKAFVEEIECNPKALHLVMIDALTAGPEAQQQLSKATATFEHLLARGFASASNPHRDLPAPLVRAIVGGVRRATFVRLRDGRIERLSKLADELRRWMLLLASPAVAELQPRTGEHTSFPAMAEPQTKVDSAADDRTQLLWSVVNLALREPYEELSAPRIAQEASLSIDTFLDLFESPRECFRAALDMLGGELLEIVANPDLVSPQWPLAVCQALERLTAHLAANPACTVMLACKTFAAGLPVIEEMVGLTDEVATLLTEGAPRRPRSGIAVEGISGALSHTLYTEASAGRAHLLPRQVEYLSYVVLAPFIGAEDAARAIVARRPAEGPPRESLLAPLARTAVGDVGQHDADEQRDHDHDDQRSFAGAEDPVDLDLVEVENGEERDQHGQHDGAAGACQLAS
jgi:AcrR family transcriptional regulator